MAPNLKRKLDSLMISSHGELSTKVLENIVSAKSSTCGSSFSGGTRCIGNNNTSVLLLIDLVWTKKATEQMDFILRLFPSSVADHFVIPPPPRSIGTEVVVETAVPTQRNVAPATICSFCLSSSTDFASFNGRPDPKSASTFLSPTGTDSESWWCTWWKANRAKNRYIRRPHRRVCNPPTSCCWTLGPSIARRLCCSDRPRSSRPAGAKIVTKYCILAETCSKWKLEVVEPMS